MASIYREGKGWAVRVRTRLHRRYKSGFRTHAEAREWARETESAVAKTKQPKGLGPQQTTLAMAFRMYAEDFSVKKKGCVQEVVRINRYLALAQLPRLKAIRKRVDMGGNVPRWSFALEERPASESHPLPRPFAAHRQARLAARPRSTAARRRLATLPVARIAAYDVNELVKAMLAEGYAPATIRIELALLSALFKTTEVWEWGKLPNVAHAVRWPSARGSARDRTLSADEEQRLAAALLDCRNPLVASFVWFAIETAVRKSEGLLIARWQDLDESRRTLKLVEAKMGPRKVPLTRTALAILQALPRGGPEERVFPLSPGGARCRLGARVQARRHREPAYPRLAPHGCNPRREAAPWRHLPLAAHHGPQELVAASSLRESHRRGRRAGARCDGSRQLGNLNVPTYRRARAPGETSRPNEDASDTTQIVRATPTRSAKFQPDTAR